MKLEQRCCLLANEQVRHRFFSKVLDSFDPRHHPQNEQMEGLVSSAGSFGEHGMSDVAVKVSEPLTLRAQLTEDWLAVVIGLLVFGAALLSISGNGVLGWAVTTSVYTDLTKALGPFAKAYAWLGGGGALIATYASLLIVLSAGVATLGADVRKFAVAFTAVFAIAYASWVIGSYAHVAAVTPAEQAKFGIS